MKIKNEYQNKAVAYIRMSTDHQEYSPYLQRSLIQDYAKSNGFELIREYIDEGKSGITAEQRPEFLAMIKLVQSGKADFAHIFVYDISRWGRFMNIDESSYYEQICIRQGVRVHYCAELFKENDIGSEFVKLSRRYQVAQYCCELGAKVFNGQKNLIQRGYRQGGAAGFGLRRQLIDHNGDIKFELKRGDRKSLQTDRVILVPGPEEEQKIVLKIYHDFVYLRKTEQQIANGLNAQNILTDRHTNWTKGVVHQILINEKYIGHNVWNKCSTSKTRKDKGKNPKEKWIRLDNAFEAIVPLGLFNAAQSIIHQRAVKLSDDELLERLKKLLEEKGKLSGLIIDESEICPSSSVYNRRFGSLIKTYALIQYHPDRDYHYIEINRLLRSQYKDIVKKTMEKIISLGGVVIKENKTDIIKINNEFTVSIVLSRCRYTSTGSKRWIIRFDMALKPDLTIAIRLDESANQVIDYYLFPMGVQLNNKLRISEDNPAELEIYHFSDLNRFFIMVERILIKEFIHGKNND